MRRLPPLGAIQAFVHVARLGSLKAAADSLALSAPALTRRIQSLEQFVGTALFDRQHNGVQLNERGIAFLVEIEPHLDALAFAVERVSVTAAAMRLSIAIPSLFAAQRLMPALRFLQQSQPSLMIDLDTGRNRLSRLGEELDAAIVIADRVDDRYYSKVLEAGRIVAIGSRKLAGDIREPADLRRVPIFLHRDMPRAFDAWRNAIGMPELEPAGTNHFDAGQLILDAAAEGLGIAFMHESHLAHSGDQRLMQIFAQTAESPYAYWFASQPSALERRPVRIFHDWLFDHFGEGESRQAAE